MNVRVHRADKWVAHWNDSKRPVDHSFIDIDAPREDHVGKEDGITQAFEDDIVVVLSVWELFYLFAR